MTREGGAGERGTVAVTVALALTVLLGIAALVVDVGLSWAARAEAQTAADAAALAGAGRLAAGPAEAVAAVRQYLDANVPGLAGGPADPDWPLNGSDDDGEVVCSVRGTAVTLYLACTTYPTPCDALGAGFSLTADASYAATAPTDGPYANIALFSDRDNLTPSSSPPPPPAPSTPERPPGAGLDRRPPDLAPGHPRPPPDPLHRRSPGHPRPARRQGRSATAPHPPGADPMKGPAGASPDRL